jgi:hypothetical protein
MKFYGLPIKKPLDRHRWFFTKKDAVKFVTNKASLNGFKILQLDYIGGGRGVKGLMIQKIIKLCFRNDIEDFGLNPGTGYFVLQNNNIAS